MQFQGRQNLSSAIPLCLVTLTVLYPLILTESAYALQDTKITLTFSNDRPLRGDVLKVSGRLSTVEGDAPIPLVSVKLQYHRLGETDVAREVATITSNPGGLFEDLVNTTYLLRIGTWVVNASFPSQLGYESTSASKTFTVVVQPSISLYVSTHSIALGQAVTFHGLLFACIPCLQDQVIVTLTRPDGSSVAITLNLVASGGPYPGGYYEGSFTPDKPGRWTLTAVWKGNDVTLPVSSEVEKVDVEEPGVLARVTFAGALVLAVGCAVVIVLYRRKTNREPKRK